MKRFPKKKPVHKKSRSRETILTTVTVLALIANVVLVFFVFKTTYPKSTVELSEMSMLVNEDAYQDSTYLDSVCVKVNFFNSGNKTTTVHKIVIFVFVEDEPQKMMFYTNDNLNIKLEPGEGNTYMARRYILHSSQILNKKLELNLIALSPPIQKWTNAEKQKDLEVIKKALKTHLEDKATLQIGLGYGTFFIQKKTKILIWFYHSNGSNTYEIEPKYDVIRAIHFN